LERYRGRHGLDWDDPRLQMVDLQYSDLRPGRGLYDRLRAAGAVPTLVSQEEVDRAVRTAPRSTRAHLRGGLIAAHRDRVPSAGWDAITLAGPAGGHRLRLADPRLGSADWCAQHGIDPADDPESLLEALHRAVGPRCQPPAIRGGPHVPAVPERPRLRSRRRAGRRRRHRRADLRLRPGGGRPARRDRLGARDERRDLRALLRAEGRTVTG